MVKWQPTSCGKINCPLLFRKIHNSLHDRHLALFFNVLETGDYSLSTHTHTRPEQIGHTFYVVCSESQRIYNVRDTGGCGAPAEAVLFTRFLLFSSTDRNFLFWYYILILVRAFRCQS